MGVKSVRPGGKSVRGMCCHHCTFHQQISLSTAWPDLLRGACPFNQLCVAATISTLDPLSGHQRGIKHEQHDTDERNCPTKALLTALRCNPGPTGHHCTAMWMALIIMQRMLVGWLDGSRTSFLELVTLLMCSLLYFIHRYIICNKIIYI